MEESINRKIQSRQACAESKTLIQNYWICDSSDTVPSSQVQSHEFKPQYHQKKICKTARNAGVVEYACNSSTQKTEARG
jgi:hypothetical protein